MSVEPICLERLVLREINKYDGVQLIQWRNQPEIRSILFNPSRLTIEKHEEWFKAYQRNSERLDFVIIEKSTGEPIGTVGLYNIDETQNTCGVSYMIGKQEARGKGYALEAVRGICYYAFNRFKVQRIKAEILESNKASKNLVEKMGFIYNESLDHLKQGRKFNVYCLDKNRSEWWLG